MAIDKQNRAKLRAEIGARLAEDSRLVQVVSQANTAIRDQEALVERLKVDVELRARMGGAKAVRDAEDKLYDLATPHAAAEDALKKWRAQNGTPDALQQQITELDKADAAELIAERQSTYKSAVAKHVTNVLSLQRDELALQSYFEESERLFPGQRIHGALPAGLADGVITGRVSKFTATWRFIEDVSRADRSLVPADHPALEKVLKEDGSPCPKCRVIGKFQNTSEKWRCTSCGHDWDARKVSIASAK